MREVSNRHIILAAKRLAGVALKGESEEFIECKQKHRSEGIDPTFETLGRQKHRYPWLHKKITANDKKNLRGGGGLGYLMLQSKLCPDIFAKSLTENLRIWFSIKSEEESMPRKVAFL